MVQRRKRRRNVRGCEMWRKKIRNSKVHLIRVLVKKSEGVEYRNYIGDNISNFPEAVKNH